MDQAIVGVCYDKRQRRILDLTFPSWRRYGERRGLPVIILERSYADEDFYWNKHRLYRAPELRSCQRLLFLDNDVFIGAHAAPLLEEWDSPLIGATCESAQAGWSREYIDQYYHDYFVDRSSPLPEPKIINTGVLVIPREQADFLESVYQSWKRRMKAFPAESRSRNDPFIRAADQPHVSYALQTAGRYQDFGERFNTLWWHWYRKNVDPRQLPFLLRSKAASLTRDVLPGPLWRALFHRERAIFAQAREASDFLHVAGSKSSLFLES
jgi:hypothetical protein